MADYKSGLDDDLSQYGIPPAVDPLGRMGIDPDWAMMNRGDAMKALDQTPMEQQSHAWNAAVKNNTPWPPPTAALGLSGAPASPSTPPATPSASAGDRHARGRGGPGRRRGAVSDAERGSQFAARRHQGPGTSGAPGNECGGSPQRRHRQASEPG